MNLFSRVIFILALLLLQTVVHAAPPVAVAKITVDGDEVSSTVVPTPRHKPIKLIGSDSTDVDGNISSYQWTQTAGTPVEIFDLNQATADAEVVIDEMLDKLTAPTTLEFQLLVTDQLGEMDTATVSIDIDFVVLIDAPQTVARSVDDLILDASASANMNGDTLTFSWQQVHGPTVVLDNPFEPVASVFAANLITGTLTFQVDISDGSETISKRVAVVVTEANQVSVPFVDAGYFSHVISNLDNSTLQSKRFTSANGNGDHQFMLTGPQGTSIFTNDHHSYLIFDLTAVDVTVTAARLRIWVWTENGNEIVAGLLRSDSSEIFQLRSVDNYSAVEIMSVPFDDTSNHTLDVPIWTDLGDGELYGEIEITALHELGMEVDENNVVVGSGLSASPHPFAITSDLECADGAHPGEACGRWLEIDLTGALFDLNAQDGLFVIGGSTTEDFGITVIRQVLSGTVFDSTSSFQSFRTVRPELLLTLDANAEPPQRSGPGADADVSVGMLSCRFLLCLIPFVVLRLYSPACARYK